MRKKDSSDRGSRDAPPPAAVVQRSTAMEGSGDGDNEAAVFETRPIERLEEEVVNRIAAGEASYPFSICVHALERA